LGETSHFPNAIEPVGTGSGAERKVIDSRRPPPILLSKGQRLNRWHLRVAHAIGHVIVIVWDLCDMVNRGRRAMCPKMRRKRVVSRNNVRRLLQHLHVRRAPDTVNFVEIGGNGDVAKRRRIGRVEGVQAEEEPKGWGPDNVGTHKEPPWVGTVVHERGYDSNLDRAKLAAVNDKLCI